VRALPSEKGPNGGKALWRGAAGPSVEGLH
jgi:hypothetical protein